MDPENIEERVSALESQVHNLDRRVRAGEQDAKAARILAGAADRDVVDLGGELREVRSEVGAFRRATTASFNAVREDMNDLRSEMNTRFERVDQRFDQVGQEFERVDNGFIGIRGKLDAVAAGQQQIVDLIQGLMDERG